MKLQRHLDRRVKEILEGSRAYSFVGPFKADVLGKPYFTLANSGRKPEGEGVVPTATAAEAIDQFCDQLRAEIGNRECPEIVWRRRPAVEQCFENGRYKVTARLLVYPE